MPNIKSAIKRVKQSESANARNVSRKSAIKTAIKSVIAALDKKDIEQARELLKDVEAKISRARSKGVIHANTAARRVSRIAKKVSAAEKAA